MDGNSWSKRVLTLDTHTSTLTISRNHHPNNVFYHAIKPAVVQRWPHYCMDAIHNDCYSTEAKRTVCVIGRAVDVPDFSATDEMAFVAIPIPSSSLVTPMQREASATGAAFTSGGADAQKRKQRRVQGAAFDAWMLRFTSQESYEVAVRMLEAMNGVTFAGKRIQTLPIAAAADATSV